jgi:hypothetical protein
MLIGYGELYHKYKKNIDTNKKKKIPAGSGQENCKVTTEFY